MFSPICCPVRLCVDVVRCCFCFKLVGGCDHVAPDCRRLYRWLPRAPPPFPYRFFSCQHVGYYFFSWQLKCSRYMYVLYQQLVTLFVDICHVNNRFPNSCRQINCCRFRVDIWMASLRLTQRSALRCALVDSATYVTC